LQLHALCHMHFGLATARVVCALRHHRL
jgi:hypothetical protein